MQQTVEGFRLSPQQARLWQFLQQSNAYQGWCSVLIEGQLDAALLQHAMETTIARHEIYRTSFNHLPGISLPLQVINADPLYTWQYVDLSAYQSQEQQRLLEELTQAEKALVIDIEQGPLVYSTILALTEDKYIWSVRLSALHADPQTLQNFVREVALCYHSSAGFAEEVIQYIQVSEWQNTLLQEDRDEEIAYWNKKDLSDFFTLSLPFKTKTDAQDSFAPDILTVPLSLNKYPQMEELLSSRQVTFPVLFLACWYILLWKLTEQDEILIGLSADGRIEGLQDTAGLIAKCLPFVCSLHGQQTSRELLILMQDAYDELLSHQPYFSWNELEGATNSAPFSCPFNFEWREQPDPWTAGAVSFTLQQWESYSEPFHVKLVVLHGSADLTIQLHFDSNLFSTQHIQRLAEQFSLLVEQIVMLPEQSLGTLDILSAAERQQLLVQFNQTSADYPADICLHQMFEQQAARTPDAIAVESEQGQLTYHQLNRLANQFAHYLQRLGVGPEVLVGIGLEHSLELVISILGILKAGGAYVPLDTTSPKQRLASLIESAHLSMLVTDSSLLASFPSVQQIVCLDTDWSSILHESSEPLPTNTASPTNLAYVIYTSGSTGQPKGVMIPHQGVVHYVDWSSKHYAIANGTGSPVHSPLSFDLTITSLFPSLMVGRRLLLVPDSPGVEALSQTLLMRNAFSVLKITPAHLNLLNQSLQPEELAEVAQTLIIGGEALHSESVRRWRSSAPAIRLINEYGPTETVVGCCIYEIPPEEELLGIIPIGRPIPNTQIYLLDAQMQPVPLGATGELYIGGVGVGRGYLNQPDLTAERFIANPFSTEPGARLYKTGDLARYVSANGTLEYLGRLDHQIKLRGYRIELAEIEAVLRQHPQVSDCIVMLQEEGPTAPRLVSYVVARMASKLLPEALAEMLRNYLPAYMVPSAFIMLEAWPLTPNGKIDRRRLPRPEQALEHIPTVLELPRNPIEEVLLQMWKELLAMPLSGVHDNFFTLGGHSLLATRLVAQIRSVLQVELNVQTVFEFPTIAGIAQQIEQIMRKGEEMQVPALVAQARPEELPLSFAQQRLWLLDQLEPGSTAYLLPSALSIAGEIDAQMLERSMQELLRRHESLRTTFSEREGHPLQVIHPVGHYTLPVIDLQGLRSAHRMQAAEHLAAQEAQHPCDLKQGPLLRTALLRLEPEAHVLLLTLHHIITDGWSNGILVHELSTLYRAWTAGQSSSLAPLPIQYADYALWQRAWLQGEVLEAQLTYWRTQLTDASPLALPTDAPRPVVQTHRGAVQLLHLSTTLTEQLVALSQREQVTLFMTLLASFQVLLMRYSGQSDISVGTPIANRRHAETEGVIGFFVNTLVLRTDLSGNPSFRELLQRVREVCLVAYVHQDVPFEQVVEALEPERDLSRSPLFQVLFVLQNVPQEQDALPGVHVRTLRTEQVNSKFDLTLSVEESQQGLHVALDPIWAWRGTLPPA